jgi:hypothetical protein
MPNEIRKVTKYEFGKYMYLYSLSEEFYLLGYNAV